MAEEEKISGIEVPSQGEEALPDSDTTDIVIHYEPSGSDASVEKSIDISIERGKAFALIGDADIAGFTFRLPITNLEKIGVTMIFLDPKSVLDPNKTVFDHICDIVMIHQHASRIVATEKTSQILKNVGISDERAKDYPHELSDEMKQRVVIAAALAHDPILLVANETECGLDPTIKLQLLRLVTGIISDTDMTLLLITKDTELADEVCDDELFLSD